MKSSLKNPKIIKITTHDIDYYKMLNGYVRHGGERHIIVLDVRFRKTVINFENFNFILLVFP